MRNTMTKLPALVLALLLSLTVLASPASAFSGEGEALPNKVNTSWAEDVEPEQTTGGLEPGKSEPPSETSGTEKALTPEGNLTLVDDLTDNTGRDKEFLTVTTRNGHYFYLIVDRAKSGENTVHFLNQVDESDLLSIIEDKEAEAAPVVCTCSDHCYPGHVDTACPVCAVNMSECTGREKEPEQTDTPELEPEKEPERKNLFRNINPVPAIIALSVFIAGGVAYLLKFKTPKPDAKGSAELDDYDFGEVDTDEEDDDRKDADL